MPDDISLDKIISGGYTRAGEQNFADISSLFTGKPAPVYTQDAANLRMSQLDLQQKQTQMDAQKRLASLMTKPPTTPEGNLDYNALADMVVFTDPKMAIDMRKEAREETKQKVDTAVAQLDFSVKQRAALADSLGAVDDQASLDRFVADAKAAKVGLPQSFPTVYSDAAKGQLSQAADALRGQTAQDQRRLNQARAAHTEAQAREANAKAQEDKAIADLDRERADRLRHGLPERVPARASKEDALVKSYAVSAARAPTPEEEKLLEGRLIPRLSKQMGLAADDFAVDATTKEPKNANARARLEQISAEVHAQTYQNLIDQVEAGKNPDAVKAQREAIDATLKGVKEKYKTQKGGFFSDDSTSLDTSRVTFDDRATLLKDLRSGEDEDDVKSDFDSHYGAGAADAVIEEEKRKGASNAPRALTDTVRG